MFAGLQHRTATSSSLAIASETIPNQKGKQTERPTLRWVLQCFQSVHLIWVGGRKWAIKLNDVQRNEDLINALLEL